MRNRIADLESVVRKLWGVLQPLLFTCPAPTDSPLGKAHPRWELGIGMRRLSRYGNPYEPSVDRWACAWPPQHQLWGRWYGRPSRLLHSYCCSKYLCIHTLWTIKLTLFSHPTKTPRSSVIVVAKIWPRLTWWRYLILFTHSNILQHSLKPIDMMTFAWLSVL